MTYTLDFALALGSGKTGITDLRGQLVDTAGSNVGSAVSTGFVEMGTSGNYLWHYAAIPDAHRGGVKFYSNAASSVILAFTSINPEETEYGDAKTSSRLAPTIPGVTLDVSMEGNAGIDWSNILWPSTPVDLEHTTIDSSAWPTLADIVDAIFDEALGAHTGLLTLLARTGADADTLKTLSDQLDALAVAGAGVGSSTLVYTVTDERTGLPVADVMVWATTDIPGANVVAGRRTSTLGVVTLFLDPGTYYIWRRKAGYTFENPDTEVVT